MITEEKRKILTNLFTQWSGITPDKIIPLPSSGSRREYLRMFGDSQTAIGVYYDDIRENKTFLTFTKHFLKKRLNVPEIYREDRSGVAYLLQDLGDLTLYSYVLEEKRSGQYDKNMVSYYQSALRELIRFQIDGADQLNFSLSIPRSIFDKQSVLWDLYYFKYCFLKILKISFDEQKLEDDFQELSDYLIATDNRYFMYRDFQSRNILLFNNDIYFVDYQGGRMGPLQYDPASLLFEAKINLSPEIRNQLLEFYLNELSKRIKIDSKNFEIFYYHFVLIRTMQVLGTYGLRGIMEGKPHFQESIPYALNNLKWLIGNVRFEVRIPELLRAFEKLVDLKCFPVCSDLEYSRLKVLINSFSYKKGIPINMSGHGIGFVFDCRALPNPGRFDKFRDYTGNDIQVIKYLDEEKEVQTFLDHVFQMVDQMVRVYLDRQFNHLTVNFGCTGGQHRSVYCAEKLKNHIQQKYPVEVDIFHREI